jgi:cytochrome b561
MLITEHDTLHMHKILGFGCLTHYVYRIFCKVKYGTMFFDNNSIASYATPVIHLSLSLSSFMFQVPTYRFYTKAIIWKELQLHNIIFASRSAFVMYHTLLSNDNNLKYYYIRLGIILVHHYLADLVTNAYQMDDKTTTRYIPFDTDSYILPYITKNFYAISQLVATSNLLLSKSYENAFGIMFPIQLSAFLMTLVRKNIISNNQWHLFYTLSLAIPYIINRKSINLQNDQFYPSILYVFSRLVLNVNKYTNMICLTYIYNLMIL